LGFRDRLLTYLLTYLLTPWCRTLFEKLIVTQPLENILLSLWNPKVHYHVHKSPPLDPILSQPNPVRPIDPYLPKVQLNVILPPTPRSSQPNPCKHLSPPRACHMSRPPHPPWFNHPNNNWWRIQAMKFIMQFSPRPIFLPKGPNIFLNTLFSKLLSLCSSLKVRDQVSHPYSTTGKITFCIF
jgi:hypothetical protein